MKGKGFLLLTCLFFARPACAIVNGDAAPSLKNKVFAFWTDSRNSSASATNVVYPRCFLSAAHTTKNLELDKSKVVMGANINEEYKAQLVTRKIIHPKFIRYAQSPIPPHSRATDLGVVWATNFTGRDNLIALSDYSPARLTDNIGLPSSKPLVYDEDQGVFSEPDDQTFPGVYKRVHIFGFGALGPSDPNGFGILRKGSMNATRFVPGAALDTDPFPGAYYRLERFAPRLQQIYFADSGGPVSQSADLGQGVFAVISGGEKVGIYDPETMRSDYYYFNFATALDRSKMSEGDFRKSNWEWVNEAIDQICTKSVTVGVVGPGKVTGYISPQQRIDQETGEQYTDETDIIYNNRFDCESGLTCPQAEPDDCIEAVHYGVKTTLIARPGPNARFKYWTGLSEEHCYCADAGTGKRFLNPTCVIEEEDVGVYSGSQSRDGESCTAVFENLPVSSLPGDSNGDGVVDSGDLDDIRANWGQSVEPGTQGDLSGDGIVNSSDLDIVRANWGSQV